MKRFLTLFVLFFCWMFAGHAQDSNTDSIKFHFNLAKDKMNAGDVTGGTAEYLAAQKFAEASQNIAFLCKIQVGLGKIAAISANDGALEEAIAKAENFCGACKDTLSLGRVLLQKGVLMIKQDHLDTAIQFFKTSAAYYLLVKDTLGSANAQTKIGNVLEQQQKYKEATPYYQRFYEATLKKPDSREHLTANIYLTGNYLFQDQPAKALFHNQKVVKLAQAFGANYEYAQSLRYEALIYKGLGNNLEAYNSLSHYMEYYQDTLMSQQQLEQAEEMKAKYEAEKKETQLALQAAALQQERLKSWTLLAGLGIAILVGALLFNLTRQLHKRNEEKEFLIKEIHHRVKNNLQILSSLLHLQSRQITDETALDAVREGQNRVDAMGLIHQKLYMGDNVAKVEMKGYLEQFGQNMLDSFGLEDDQIKIAYDLESLYLDVDTAIPLGLIINELVTNSLKYAFPDGRSGVISIGLWKDDQNRLCLKVSDNGVGKAAAETLKGSTSFGTNLVQILSKKLKGKPEILKVDQGYATQIAFEQYK